MKTGKFMRIGLRWLLGGVVAVIVGVTTGFGSTTQSSRVQTVRPVSVHFIRAPKGADFLTPVWFQSMKEVALVLDDGPQVWDHHLFVLKLDGSGLRQLPIPADPQCPHNAASWPAPLPDGRLAFIQECYGNAQRLPLRVNSVIAYNPATSSVRRLRPYYLDFAAGALTFSPAGRGIFNDGYGLGERLEWLGTKRPNYLRLPLARAGTPRFSPDGHWLAVDGVPAHAGPIGTAQATRPRNLYLVSGDGRRLKTLLTNLVDNVARASWSPDGRWLALSMDPADGPDGLWLVQVATGRHFLLMGAEPRQLFGDTDWLPNGRTLIVGMAGPVQIPGVPTLHPGYKAGLNVITLPDLTKLRSS